MTHSGRTVDDNHVDVNESDFVAIIFLIVAELNSKSNITNLNIAPFGG